MAQFLTEIQFATTGSIETPEPGFITIYANTDGFLYAKLSNGTQIKLSNPGYRNLVHCCIVCSDFA
jgi:hypothetical protein